jgi:hypothetical protein
MKAPQERNSNTINVEDAVGRVLMHDITCVIPEKFKGPAFKKGHIIRNEDVEKLKSLGKEKIYVFNINEDEYHEKKKYMFLILMKMNIMKMMPLKYSNTWRVLMCLCPAHPKGKYFFLPK